MVRVFVRCWQYFRDLDLSQPYTFSVHAIKIKSMAVPDFIPAEVDVDRLLPDFRLWDRAVEALIVNPDCDLEEEVCQDNPEDEQHDMMELEM